MPKDRDFYDYVKLINQKSKRHLDICQLKNWTWQVRAILNGRDILFAVDEDLHVALESIYKQIKQKQTTPSPSKKRTRLKL